MRYLIVSADDFGYTPGVNRGILHAYRQGIVSSTSLLANGAAFEDAVALSRQEPGLDVGCHLNFVEGNPLSPTNQISHLVSPQGRFAGAARLARRLLLGSIPAAELEREARAQIERLLQAGVRPTHVDTHKHTHTHPRVAAAVARVAREFDIQWIRRPFENGLPPDMGRFWERFGLRRIALSFLNRLAPAFERRTAAQQARMPDHFTGFLLTGRLTRAALVATLTALQPGITELMCHPGYCDRELERSPTHLKRERETELAAVADSGLRSQLAEQGIVLTSFRDLAEKPATGNSWLANPFPAAGTSGWSLT